MDTNKTVVENKETKESKPEGKYYFISFAYKKGVRSGFGNMFVDMKCPHFDFDKAKELYRNANGLDSVIILFYREITKEEFDLSMQERNEDSGDTVTESKIEQEEQSKENDPEKQKIHQKLGKRYGLIHRGTKLALFAWAAVVLLTLVLAPKVMLMYTSSEDFVFIVKFLVLPLGILLMLMLIDFFLYRIDLEKEELEKEKMKILELMKQ